LFEEAMEESCLLGLVSFFTGAKCPFLFLVEISSIVIAGKKSEKHSQ